MRDTAPIAFISYDTEVDRSTHRVTKLREDLETELRIRLMRDTWIFQDAESIQEGQGWEDRIRESLERAKILIPIVTPSLFKRPECIKELKTFKDRQSTTGVRPQVLPLLFLRTRGIDIADRTAGTEGNDSETRDIERWLGSYQYANWIELRNLARTDAKYATEVSRLADRLVEMSSKTDTALETRAAPEVEAETRRRTDTGTSPDRDTDTETRPEASNGGQSEKPKRWLVPTLVIVGVLAALGGGSWLLVDSCHKTAEPSGICRLFLKQPELVRLDEKLEVFANRPVVARVAPDAQADIVQELENGYRFDVLWEVPNTDWYAYEREHGGRAFFRGKVFRPVQELPIQEPPPSHRPMDGQFEIFADTPVVARAAPKGTATVLDELVKGTRFDKLWEVEETEWYAFQRADGAKAYFRGDVLRRVEVQPQKPPTLIEMNGQFYISADEPGVARAAPSADARVIEPLAEGDILGTLWKVENTDWYAYDSSDGEKAYFRGNLFQPVKAR